MSQPTKQAVIKANLDAVNMLMREDPTTFSCCGAPLTELGQCFFRPGHPTPCHSAITDYPEYYDESGRYTE